MSTVQVTGNKATFRRFRDAMSSGDAEVISKTFGELFEPQVLIRNPLPVDATGAQAVMEVFGRLHQAFPDLRVAVEDVIVEGDNVVSQEHGYLDHQGECMGVPPTGKSVTYKEIVIFRFAGGRIAETWGLSMSCRRCNSSA